MKRFSLDISSLKKTVIKLENIIQDMNALRGRIVSAHAELLGEAWSGKSANQYSKDFSEWKDNFDDYIKNLTIMQQALNRDIVSRAERINWNANALAGIVGGTVGMSNDEGIIRFDWSAKEEMCNVCADLISKYDYYMKELERACTSCANLQYTSFSISGAVWGIISEVQSIQQMLQELMTAMDDYQSDVENLESAMELHMNDIQMPVDWEKEWANLLEIFDVFSGNVSILDLLQNILDALKGWNKECCTYGGDPINMSTGNFVYQREYLHLKGLYPICFKMFYNSLEKKSDVLGTGWVHNYQIHIENIQNTYTVHLEDGKTEIFYRQEDGTFLHYCGKAIKMEETEQGFIYYAMSGLTYHFSDKGFCTKVVDRSNNFLDFQYANDNKLKKITSNSNETLYYHYNNDNLLQEVSDSEGRKIVLVYKNGRPVQVINEEGNSFCYEYDTEGNLKDITNPRGFQTISNRYDEQGRIVQQIYADGGELQMEYEDEQRTIHVTEQNGNKVDYIHDDRFRSVETVYEDGRIQYAYNNRNQKIYMIDKCGNKTTYDYDAAGNMNHIVNPVGDTLDFEYNSMRKPTQIKICGKLYQSNKYDGHGNLIRKKDAIGREIQVRYNENGKPIEIIQPDQSKISLTYDNRGNIITICEPLGAEKHYEYNGLGQVCASIDANGNRTEYTYNRRGNIVSVKNAEGNIKRFFYNESDRVIRIEDFNGSVIQREYNEINKPSKFIDADGNETLFEYDSMYNVKRRVEANGAETKFIYNKLNHLEKVINAKGAWFSYEYDPNGNRTKVTGYEGTEVHLKYDAMNRLIEITDADGSVSHMEYNQFGQRSRMIDAMGNVRSYSYDEVGQRIASTDAQGNVTTYHYTSMGNIQEIIDPEGRKTCYEYLPGGLLSKVLKSDGTYVAFTYDANHNVKTRTNQAGYTLVYHYDVMNRVVKIESNQGQNKSYTYDALGNVETITDGNGNRTLYHYSQSGRLVSVTDALGNKTEYTYDSMGAIQEIHQYEADDELAEVCSINETNREVRCIKYERDILGHIEKIVDGMGNEKRYIYNERGRIIEKIDEDGFSTKYGYTKGGQLEEVLYADGKSVKLSYNPLKQLSEIEDWLGLTKIELDDHGRTEKVIDHKGRQIKYLRGSMGQRVELEYPDKKRVTYGYDAIGRLSSLKDENGEIIYSYDKNGRVSEKVFPNGLSTTYTYNAVGLIHELTHQDEEGIIDQFIYKYDVCGNKIGIVRNRRGDAQECETYEYGYDPLNRISSVTANGELLREYGYDSFGNRSFMKTKDQCIEYCYNHNNQLIRAISGADITDYSYDKRGNLVQVTENGSLKNQYEFGTNNRLMYATDEHGLESWYEYNGLGIRTCQQILDDNNPVKTIEYVTDQSKRYNNLLSQIENEETHDYIWDSNVVGECGQAGNHYYLQDEMGSVLHYVNGTGTLVDSYTYDEFGVDLSCNQGNVQPFGYTGYCFDKVADTYFAQARQYEPRIGRFSARDRIKGINTHLLSLNEYTYCWNQPLMYVDKDGALPSIEDIREDIEYACDSVGTWLGDTAYEFKQDIEAVVDSGFEGAFDIWDEYVPDSVKDTISGGTHFILEEGRNVLETDIPFLGFDVTDTWAYFSTTWLGENLLKSVNFYRDNDGIFHTEPRCWQSPFGYNSFYDFVFDGATDMEMRDNIFVVDNDGTRYTLWMWKGDYINLGAGAETGIYVGNDGDFHMLSAVDTNLYMTLRVTDQEGNPILDYAPDEQQWWITGFNPEYQDVDAEDLIVEGTVDFSENPDLFRLFFLKYNGKKGWCFDEENFTMYYTW